MKKVTITKHVLKSYDIGDYTYGVPHIIGSGQLSIGKFCSIANEVTILLNIDHHHNLCTQYPFTKIFACGFDYNVPSKGPVTIGHDVWIAHGVTILTGATIGNGATIAAHSVVTKDVAPYSVVAGNPAEHKKYRFPEEWCSYLNTKLKWWDWPVELIMENLHDLLREPGDHLFDLRKKVQAKLKEYYHETA